MNYSSLSDTRWDGVPIINYDPTVEPSTLHTTSLRRKNYRHLDSIEWAHEYAREREIKNTIEDTSKFHHYLRKSARWIVLIGTGVLIGVVTSSLDYSYEWFAGFKEGACKDGFFKTKAMCCTESNLDESSTCSSWLLWSEVVGLEDSTAGSFLYRYFVFILTSLVLAAAAAWVVRGSQFVRTSGIAEVKTIISGVVLEDFLADKTLLKKLFGLVFGVSANLWIGKEGPLVHISCCCAEMLIKLFPVLDQSESKRRELLLAASAAGISVAFNAPICGVIFTLEQLTSYFNPSDKMWTSFFCAMAGTVVLNSFKEGINVFVDMQNQWLGMEIPGFILLGIMGGLYGTFFSRLNMQFAQVRKKYIASKGEKFEILEILVLTAITSILCYPLVFPRLPLTTLVRMMYEDCDGIDEGVIGGLCSASGGATLALLGTSAVVAMILTAYTFGTMLPAGVLTPSLAIGAICGRMLGLVMQKIQEASPSLTAMCQNSPEHCISPGAYAVVGSAAFLAGTTKMTVWVVVTVFELTGALSYVLPIMVTVIVARWTNDNYDVLNCYDQWIKFLGYPFLIEVNRPLPLTKASEYLKPVSELNVIYLEDNLTVGELEAMLDYDHQGIPVIKSRENATLYGWVSVAELQFEYIKIHASARYNSARKVSFVPTTLEDDQSYSISHLVERDHIVLNPDLPLPSLVEIFFKMKPRFVLFCRDGQFSGLLTLKDITGIVEIV